jgi:hypothetical protein
VGAVAAGPAFLKRLRTIRKPWSTPRPASRFQTKEKGGRSRLESFAGGQPRPFGAQRGPNQALEDASSKRRGQPAPFSAALSEPILAEWWVSDVAGVQHFSTKRRPADAALARSPQAARLNGAREANQPDRWPNYGPDNRLRVAERAIAGRRAGFGANVDLRDQGRIPNTT